MSASSSNKTQSLKLVSAETKVSSISLLQREASSQGEYAQGPGRESSTPRIKGQHLLPKKGKTKKNTKKEQKPPGTPTSTATSASPAPTQSPSVPSDTEKAQSVSQLHSLRPSKRIVPSRVYNYKQTVVKLPPTPCFSSDIVTLHPGSAIAKRITYSKSNAKLHPFRKKLQPQSTDDANSPTAPRESRSLTRNIASRVDPNSAFAKRRAYSSGADGRGTAQFQKKQDFKIKKKTSSCPPPSNKKPASSQGKESVARSRLSSNCSDSCYYSSPSRSTSPDKHTSTPHHSFAKRRVKESVPIGRWDALSPTMRAYFTDISQIKTWNRERLMRAIYTEIERKYSSNFPVSLRPSRQFVSDLLDSTSPSEVIFETVFRKVDEGWIMPILQRYRRLYITTCMLSGISSVDYT